MTERRVRYAGAPAALLLIVVATAACGTESVGRIGQPTVATSDAPRGASAPPAADPGLPPPVFTGSPASSTPTSALPVTRRPAAPGAATSSAAVTPPRPAAAASAAPSPAAPSPAAPSPAATPPPASSSLRVVQAPIPYPPSRQQEMAAYSLRHYGTASWQLTPTMIVLHFTAGGTWAGARATFAADTPNLGELPGTCAHYIVDEDGTVYQLVPTSVRCRHTVGLNDQAIGIEMVQEAGSSAAWADQQILNRPAQVGAALALVRSLQSQFGIPTADVIGHAMANSAPQFHDRLGWHNDHADWPAADVAVFRSRL